MRYPGRRLLLLAWFCAFACCLTACGAQEEDLYWTWPFPSTEGFADMDDVDIWGNPGAAETDYDHLIAYTEYDVYPTDIDEIAGYVLNTNPGKVFFSFLYTLVEKYEDGEWVQLNYPLEEFGSFGFGFCGYNPPRPDHRHVTRKRYFVKDVAGGVEPGEYRMLLFTAKRVMYGPVPFRLAGGV